MNSFPFSPEGAAKLLAKRTLTNLYNSRPTWLDKAVSPEDDGEASDG
jgi:hypothetical protein